jgi:hypothetical protein
MLDRMLPIAALTLGHEPARALLRIADRLCREGLLGSSATEGWP